jgi:hypothetical protein
MNSEDTNEQMNEIRKTMQDMRGIFSRDVEILKKNQIETLEMESFINQMKTQLKVSPLDWNKQKTQCQGLETGRCN